MKKILTLAIFLTSFSSFTFAQDYVDLARFHYSTTPQNDFDSIPGKTNVEDFGLDVTLPIKLNEGNIILTGFI